MREHIDLIKLSFESNVLYIVFLIEDVRFKNAFRAVMALFFKGGFIKRFYVIYLRERIGACLLGSLKVAGWGDMENGFMEV